MENKAKKLNTITIVGLAVNALAILFVGYIFYTTVPKKDDLKAKPEVKAPKIENPQLEVAIGELVKPEGVPIDVDPNDLGKSNPYNF